MSAYRKSAQVDMTHGSVLGRAALFALPICAGNILQLLYSTVDTLVIGNFCDTTALASVATSSQPLEILLCVFVGIGSGISILVSQAVGRGDRDQLQKLVRTSVWLLFAASLPLTVIGFLLGPWMLQLMQVPADAMPGAVLYLRITMLGILGNMGYNFNAGLLRGIGNSSSSLLLLFISCAANIVLDLVLTGALGLGIGGVAAATAITLFLSWICSIFYIRRRCTELALPVLPCGFDAVTLPSGEKPEIVVFINDQQRALVQASYRHRYGVFIRLDLCTGLRMGELLALKWEDIDFSTAQLHVRRTINRLAKYEAHDGENKTEIVFGTPKTKNSRRTIPLTRTMVDELARWKQQQAQDKIRAGDKYTDYGFIVTNEFGHYFEQKTFKDYYDRLLKDADIGHFTFHALRHTFATRALERGMDYKTLSAILGHYSVAFTMDTYVHSMDEHKRREMDKMDDMFGMQYSISVENRPYPVLCTLSPDGCTIHVPDFPKIEVQTPTLDAALLEVKQQIQKALRQYKNPPIPTKQDQIVVPNNSVLVLVKAS